VMKGCKQLPLPIPYTARRYNLLIPLKHGIIFSHREISHSVLRSILKPHPILVSVNPAVQQNIQSRGYAMVVARILRGALKIRYLILGGALGGGMTLQKVIMFGMYCKHCLVCVLFHCSLV
jgi:hypothetical protein